MRKILLICLLIHLASTGYSQILVAKKDYVPEVRKARYSFTISLISGGQNSLVSFGIMRQLPDSTKEIIFLRQDTFLRQITGGEKSIANPDKINYVEEYGILMAVFDDLWKLKYDVHPYSTREIKGWSNGKGQPSVGQFGMLAPYGIEKNSDYCYGQELFELLIKVSDPVWVGEYQGR